MPDRYDLTAGVGVLLFVTGLGAYDWRAAAVFAGVALVWLSWIFAGRASNGTGHEPR